MLSTRSPDPGLSRAGDVLVPLSGVLAALANCAFLVRSVSGSRLDPANSLISELEVPGQPSSAFFRGASLLSALLVVVLAAGLFRRIPPGRLGVAGCWALGVFGVAGAIDAMIPMDCAPSASVTCLRAEEAGPMSWPYQAHTWFDVAGTVALLASLWLLGRHLRHDHRWRVASVTGRAGFVVLGVLSIVLTAMSVWYLPGVGLVQRLQVLAVSSWLLLLAVDQRRARAG
ncbi:MAG: DUF998 domain-containing protein [Blastococcus sp.]